MNNQRKFYQSVFERSTCLRKRQMEALLEGKLFPEEIRAIEVHLADCNLCIQALEGLKDLKGNITDVTDQIPEPLFPEVEINEQVMYSPPSPIIRNTLPKRKTKKLKRQWTPSLTLLVLLLIGGFIVYQYEIKPNKKAKLTTSKGDLDFISKETIDEDDIINSSVIKELNLDIEELEVATEENQMTNLGAEHGVSKLQESIEQIENIDSQQTTEKVVATEEESPKRDTIEKSTEKNETNTPVTVAKKEDKKEVEVVNEKPKDSKSVIVVKSNDKDFNTAIDFYQSKNYGTALLYFQEVLRNESHPQYADALYYAALSQKALGRTADVKKLVKELKKHPNQENFDMDVFK